jgi:hypothetical protein
MQRIRYRHNKIRICLLPEDGSETEPKHVAISNIFQYEIMNKKCCVDGTYTNLNSIL